MNWMDWLGSAIGLFLVIVLACAVLAVMWWLLGTTGVIPANLTNQQQFTDTERAELDQYIAEHGKSAMAAYMNGKGSRDTVETVLKYFKYFISKGADVNAGDFTPLHCTAGGNSVEIVKFLVSKGANVNAKGVSGATPLHVAAFMSEDVAIVKFLVSKGADVNAKDEDGLTPLDMARQRSPSKGKAEIVRYLSSLK